MSFSLPEDGRQTDMLIFTDTGPWSHPRALIGVDQHAPSYFSDAAPLLGLSAVVRRLRSLPAQDTCEDAASLSRCCALQMDAKIYCLSLSLSFSATVTRLELNLVVGSE